MAARRLLIVMLVLLGISSVFAIALPEPDRGGSDSEQSATTGETGATGTTGERDENDQVTAAGGNEATEPDRQTVHLEAEKPIRIEAEPGSRMILTVKSKVGSEVEIDGLGRFDFASPYAPAIFDMILPREPGKYQVRQPGEEPSAIIVTRT